MILREYNGRIHDKGIVEMVDQSSTTPRKTHYLPHHALIWQDKELRIVYDTSAQSNGPSLNNCLYTSPKFNQKILELLLQRFQFYPVTWIAVADIEKAFLIISVTPKDVLRRITWTQSTQRL